MIVKRMINSIRNGLYNCIPGITIEKEAVLKSRIKVKRSGSGVIIIRSGTRISSGCYLSSTDNACLEIGNNVFFNRNCTIVTRDSVTIGDNSLFGPDVQIYDHNHKYNKEHVLNSFSTSRITIGRDVWVGAGCILLKNAKIGDHCIIGAGVIVDYDVPDYSVVTVDRKSFTIKPMRE